MNSDKTTTDSAASLTPISLYRGDQVIMVAPKGRGHESDPPPFESFELPRLSQTLCDSLMSFSHRFWNAHQRCVAALLLLDARHRDWIPFIPAQRCGPDA